MRNREKEALMPDHAGPFSQTLSPFPQHPSPPPLSPSPKKDLKERLTQCRLVSEARSPFDATDAPQMTRMSKSKKQFPEMTFVYFLAHL